MAEINSIIKPLVERFSPACAGIDEDYLLDLGSMPLRETIPLFYAFLGIPTVVLPEQLHTLPRVQEYIWASIMQMTGQDTRPVVLAVSDSKEWIRGYDWDRGTYGKLTEFNFLDSLNRTARTYGLDPEMLDILGVDNYDRVYIGLLNGEYKEHLAEHIPSNAKIMDILEAGLILSHRPPGLIEKFQVARAVEVPPANLNKEVIIQGLTGLLSILNSPKTRNGDVSVREIRFFVEFKDYLRFDVSARKWVYTGGYDVNSYNADELAQQTRAVVDGMASCWSQVDTQSEGDRPEANKYKKRGSLYTQAGKEVLKKHCPGCPLQRICNEYRENEGTETQGESMVTEVMSILARYLARTRVGMIQRFRTSGDSNPVYIFYSPVNLRQQYRIDSETAKVVPLMQGVLEVSFSMESYQRYYEQNFGQVRQDRTPKPPGQPTVATRPTIIQEPGMSASDPRQTNRPSQGIPAFLRDRVPVTTDRQPLPPGGAGSINTQGNIAPETKGAQAQPRFKAVTIELGRAGLKGDWMDKAATAIRSGGSLQHELLRGAEVKEIKPGVYEVLATNHILNRALKEVEAQRGGEMATKIRIEVVDGMLHAKFLFPIDDSGQGKRKAQEPRKTRVVGDIGEEW